MKSDDQLSKICSERGINIGSPMLHSCGSGVTACVVDLAMRILGAPESVVYDGSWTEYGSIEEPDFESDCSQLA